MAPWPEGERGENAVVSAEPSWRQSKGTTQDLRQLQSNEFGNGACFVATERLESPRFPIHLAQGVSE